MAIRSHRFDLLTQWLVVVRKKNRHSKTIHWWWTPHLRSIGSRPVKDVQHRNSGLFTPEAAGPNR